VKRQTIDSAPGDELFAITEPHALATDTEPQWLSPLSPQTEQPETRREKTGDDEDCN